MKQAGLAVMLALGVAIGFALASADPTLAKAQTYSRQQIYVNQVVADGLKQSSYVDGNQIVGFSCTGARDNADCFVLSVK